MAKSYPEDGTKAKQIEYMAANSEFTDAHAIAFCVGASPDYARKVLND